MKKIVLAVVALLMLAALATEGLASAYCDHDWTRWYVEREATCTHSGYKVRYCRICGMMEERDIARTGHNFGKWKTIREATCTSKGKKRRTCKNCGYEETKEIPKGAHQYGSWTVTVEPTCMSKGEHTRTCKICGHRDTEAMPKAAHKYGPWYITEPATCTKTGKQEHTCVVCGHVDTQTINMLPHSYEWQVIIEATDHSAGTRAKVCTVCGKSEKPERYDPEGTLRRKDRGEAVRELQELLVEQGYLNKGGADGAFGAGTEKALIQFQKDQGLNADGVAWPQTLQRLKHDFGPWETVKELTRTEPGERVRTCKDCGYQQHEIVESGDVLEIGRRGEDIRAIQQMLRQLGFDPGGIDGIYGKRLDIAFAAFAKDYGLPYESGKVLPGEIDALMNAWLKIQPEDQWRGEGRADSPVSMALTVTPVGDEEGDMRTFSWTLTNLGAEKCMFNALLLTYGRAPDFKQDNLVMVVNGFELKPNCGNATSGSFSVASNWGTGKLNFAALAVSEKDGGKWLSNIVSFEDPNAPKVRTVAPIAVDLNVAALPDGAYPVAFNSGDVARVASGTYMNAVQVYTMDTYDVGEIDALEEGDTVVVDGESIKVKSVEKQDGDVLVNGGLDGDNGQVFSLTEDGDAYCLRLYDDMATYTERGATTLKLAPEATFVDESDLDKGPVKAGYDDIVNALQNAENNFFDQYNTEVTIVNGLVTSIARHYVP